MKLFRVPLITLLALSFSLWTGCDGNGGGGQGRTIGDGGGTGSGSFLLVSDTGTNRLLVVSIASDGTLSTLGNAATGSQPRAVVVAPNGKVVYVLSSGSTNLSAFTVGSDGTLTPVGIGNFSTGLNPSALAISAGGGFMAVANQGSNTISLFSMDLNGNLVALSPASTIVAPRALAFANNILFVANGNQIEALQLNPTLGVLSPLVAPITVGTDIRALAVAGNFLYAADAGLNAVLAFPIDPTTGQLGASTSTATGLEPTAMLVDPTGKFLYVVNRTDGSVSAFGVNINTGALTTVGTISTSGTTPTAVAFDALNSMLFVVNTGSNSIAGFDVNTTTGALTAVGTPFPAGTQPGGLAVAKP